MANSTPNLPTSSSFLLKIVADFPDFSFRPGKKFSFRPPKTIFYPKDYNLEKLDSKSSYFKLSLLHEIGHALSKHHSFDTCAKRVKMEVEAWEKARFLTKKYQLKVDEDFIESELDSYRNWLYQKSKCPRCSLTRFETPDGNWHCPCCDFFKKHL